MVTETLALKRIGEWADLSGEDFHIYLDIAADVQSEKLDEQRSSERLSGEEYFEFLNKEVLPDERVIDQLEFAEISGEKLPLFREGRVPIEDLYSEQYRFDYGLDQVADFVMMMKFIRDYMEETGEDGVAPRNRLQYLIYLVNYNLSKEDTLPNRSNRTSLGNLEHTGYRYTFSKSQRGPFSQKLYRDKNRLFAQQLLHEEVMEESPSQEDEPYRISLGVAGKRLFARYGGKLDEMESVLLKEWDFQQREVLDEYAEMPNWKLKDTIQSMPKFEATSFTDEVLQPRVRDFDEPIDPIQELTLSV